MPILTSPHQMDAPVIVLWFASGLFRVSVLSSSTRPSVRQFGDRKSSQNKRTPPRVVIFFSFFLLLFSLSLSSFFFFFFSFLFFSSSSSSSLFLSFFLSLFLLVILLHDKEGKILRIRIHSLGIRFRISVVNEAISPCTSPSKEQRCVVLMHIAQFCKLKRVNRNEQKRNLSTKI